MIFALTATKVTGRTMLIACRYRRNGVKTKSGRSPQTSARMYGSQNSITLGFAPLARISGMDAMVSAAVKGVRKIPSQTPCISVCRQSRSSRAPYAWATRVSIPSSRPVKLIASG